MKFQYIIISFIFLFITTNSFSQTYYSHDEFCMGADMSYVNHIEDKGAVWREDGESTDPYQLFARHGGNCARFRIWHNPQWTKQVYIDAGQEATQLYHDYYDVKEAIKRSKEQGLAVCLDFHYSDTWADPGNQELPAAWEGLTFDQVNDSLYAYTFRVLSALDAEGLMPEYVQVGNEINPGFLFPHGRLSTSKSNLATLLNRTIQAVKDAGSQSTIMPKIIIHIAQPENVDWWFTEMTAAGVSGFDIIGFSYYARWSDVPLSEISGYIPGWKSKFGKDVMCVETAYLWKIYGSSPTEGELEQMEPNYYPSVSGQKKYFIDLVQEIIDGGGKGMMPWEPFWVTGQTMINESGQIGANWHDKSFFDYSKGNEVNPSIDYMNYTYPGISGETRPTDSVEVGVRLHVKSAEIEGADFFVEGSFTGGTKVQLQKTADTIYSLNIKLPEKSFHVYRFYKEAQPETVPEVFRVGNTTDRAFSAPASDTVFNDYWQHIYKKADSVKITFRVNMEGYTVHEDGMYIYGKFFDSWGPRMAMEKVGKNLYAKTLTLLANSEVYFRFFNGYDWGNTETIPTWCRYGDYNRIFPVPDFDATYDFQYNVCGHQLCDTCGQTNSTIQNFRTDEYIVFINESNQVEARFPEDITRIFITDARGRKLAEKKILKTTHTVVNAVLWQPGIYVAVFLTEKNNPVARKFILRK